MVLALAVLIYTVADPECVPYIYGRQLELKAAPELSLKHLYTHLYIKTASSLSNCQMNLSQ